MAAVKADAREAAGEARRHGMARRLRDRISGMNEALAGMRPGVAWVAASIVLLAGIASGATDLYAISEGTSGDDNASQTIAAKVDKMRVPNGSGSLVLPATPGTVRFCGCTACPPWRTTPSTRYGSGAMTR